MSLDEDENIVPMGIHGRTGLPFHAPEPITKFQEILQTNLVAPTAVESQAVRARRGESFALPFGTDANDLRSTGWGVVFAKNSPPEVRDALKPLLDHRKKAIPARLYRESECHPDETLSDFLKRHNVAIGTQLPHRLPYHLLLVGSPEEISFEFQCQLDLEYSVGRVHFASPDQYRAYAQSVVDYETGVTKARKKQVGFFAPTHGGDAATQLSARAFIAPLAESDPDVGATLELLGTNAVVVSGEDAKREALRKFLGGGAEQPAILWTAGHGMAFDADDPEQLELQGALLASDWTGTGRIQRDHYFAASDLRDEDDVRGLVAFLFACFGAGTPRIDSYPKGSGARPEIAKKPFVAALPQKLLAKGALGVIGHVDLAWAYSFKPRESKGPQLIPYANCLASLLTGRCIGNSTGDLSSRAAMLGSQMADAVMPGNTPARLGDLVQMWCERNDARAYILLGDPAAKLRFD